MWFSALPWNTAKRPSALAESRMDCPPGVAPAMPVAWSVSTSDVPATRSWRIVSSPWLRSLVPGTRSLACVTKAIQAPSALMPARLEYPFPVACAESSDPLTSELVPETRSNTNTSDPKLESVCPATRSTAPLWKTTREPSAASWK